MAQQPLVRADRRGLREQISVRAVHRGSQLPTEDELRGAVPRVTEHRRDADQAAGRPGPGRDKARPRHLRHHRGRPVRHRAHRAARAAGRRRGMAAYLLEVAPRNHRRPITKPRVEVQTAPEAVTRRLRVPPGTQLVSRHERRYIDDLPMVSADLFLSDGVHRPGCHPAADGRGHRRGAVRYLGRNDRTLRRSATGTGSPLRRPDSNEQSSFGLRTTPPFSRSSAPASTRAGAHSGHGDSVPRRPEPVHRQRRGRSPRPQVRVSLKPGKTTACFSNDRGVR